MRVFCKGMQPGLFSPSVVRGSWAELLSDLNRVRHTLVLQGLRDGFPLSRVLAELLSNVAVVRAHFFLVLAVDLGMRRGRGRVAVW